MDMCWYVIKTLVLLGVIGILIIYLLILFEIGRTNEARRKRRVKNGE